MTLPNDELSLKPLNRGRWYAVAEVLLIFLFFCFFAGSPPPDVNESHYLAKAKHYWDRSWCPEDHFLESADAHLMFYWTIGWLTKFFSLSTTAWIGRLFTWLLLAWSWKRFSDTLISPSFWALPASAIFLGLLKHFHMAGEWVVGGVEAKGFAFVFVFLGFEAVCRSRWRHVWLFLGAASAFHVLVGGWAVMMAGLAWLMSGRERVSLKQMAPMLAVGFLLSLPGLVPALVLSSGVLPEIVQQANRIYVYKRLSHHLVPHLIQPVFVWRYLGLLAVGLVVFYFSRKQIQLRPLYRLVLASLAIAVAGVVIDQATIYRPDLGAGLLRYYWFRMSDVMLPLGVTFGVLGILASKLTSRPQWKSWAGVVLTMVVVLVAGEAGFEKYQFSLPAADRSGRVADYQQWRSVCDWISKNTQPEDRFLTPRLQQTFKWYAGRSEVFTPKDIPQDPESLVEWWRRRIDLFPSDKKIHSLAQWKQARLVELGKKYDCDYLVLDQTAARPRFSLKRVYPEYRKMTRYVIYQFPLSDEPEVASEKRDK